MPEKANARNCSAGRTSSGRAILAGAAAAELVLLVEEQIARCLAVLHGQRGQGVAFRVKLHHAPEIDGADDIDVVHDKWLIGPLAAVQERTMRLSSSRRRCRASLFARDFNAHAEVAVRFR